MRVWRRKSPAQLPAGPNPRNGSPAGEVPGDGGEDCLRSCDTGTRAAMGDRERRPRRRRRPRFRQSAASSTPVDPGPSISSAVAPPDALAAPTQSLQCIINWDDRMARAQEDLANAVIVTVCGVEPLAPAGEVAEVLVARLGVEAGSLVLRQTSSSSYLLVLPDSGFV